MDAYMSAKEMKERILFLVQQINATAILWLFGSAPILSRSSCRFVRSMPTLRACSITSTLCACLGEYNNSPFAQQFINPLNYTNYETEEFNKGTKRVVRKD